MASAIRDFSYLFIYSRKLENYGLASRLLLSVFFIIGSLTIRASPVEIMVFKLISMITGEIIVLSYFKGLRTTLSALKLVVFFISLGLFINALSVLMGYIPISFNDIVVGSLQLVAIFIAFSLMFQLISIREWKHLLKALGLREYSILFSMVMSQIPIVLYYASEAFTTTRLKYGNKRVYKFVVPLVLLSLYTSRSLVESYVQYGAQAESKFVAFRERDLYIYVLLIPLIILFLAL